MNVFLKTLLIGTFITGCKGGSIGNIDAESVTASVGPPSIVTFSENNIESRERLATKLSSDFSVLLSSSTPNLEVTKVSVAASILQLRKGSKACSEGDKITLYRGGNPHLLKTSSENQISEFQGQDGWFYLSPAIVLSIPFERFGATKAGGKWTYIGKPFEEQFPSFRKIKSVMYQPMSDLQAFAKRADPSPLSNPLDFEALSARHTGDSTGSPYISLSSSFSVASWFTSPVIAARFCPGRVFPTYSTQHDNELEWLVYGTILPEEIVKIYGVEDLPLSRQYLNQRIEARGETTESVAKLKEELDEKSSRLNESTPPGTITGDIQRYAEKCVSVPTFHEKGDKSFARQAISEAYRSYSSRVVAEFTRRQNGQDTTGNFLAESKSFFEKRCECKSLIREANEIARQGEGTFFWSEEACDIEESAM